MSSMRWASCTASCARNDCVLPPVVARTRIRLRMPRKFSRCARNCAAAASAVGAEIGATAAPFGRPVAHDITTSASSTPPATRNTLLLLQLGDLGADLLAFLPLRVEAQRGAIAAQRTLHVAALRQDVAEVLV